MKKLFLFLVPLILFAACGDGTLTNQEQVEQTEQVVVTQESNDESSLTGVLFIVSSVDTDGVWCGDRVKLLGKFREHQYGDTIYVEL